MLPHNHKFTKLYSEYIHSSSHSGVATTVAKIRLRFWVTKLPQLVKSIRYRCVDCKKLDKIVGKQIMAPLPEERLKPSPAFYNTSLDFFGPFQIKGEVNKRSRGKAYAVIFTRLSCRAVYCDLS